jgi:methionyl-tRNA formyltransferase
LQALTRDPRFDVVGVVTMPDVKSGRGQQVHENSIGAAANELGIPTVLKPTRINPEKSEEGAAFAAQLRALQPDYSVVVAYGKIFPQSILDIPSF